MGSSDGFVLETEGINSGAPSPPPPQLPLFSLSLRPMKSSSLPATHYGKWLVTPPHHAASIPFRWEEEPGKPRVNCCKSNNQLQLALYHDYDGGDVNTNNGDDDDDDHLMFKSLELPPRLQFNKNSKTPSPTTVLKGPYVIGKSIFHSFRMSGDRHRIRNGSASFDAGSGGDEVAVVVSKRVVNYKGNSNGSRRRKLLGLWSGKKQKGKYDKRREEAVDDEFGGSDKDSFDFSSVSCGGDDDSGENWDRKTEMKKSSKTTTRSLGLTKAAGGSHFWANIYGAVKQVVIPTSRRNKATKR